DEPLLEISTDKVDTEVPSPASGTLTQILVQEGATVDVGTKLGQIGGSAAGEAPEAEAAEPEPPAPAAEEAPAPATAEAAAEADAASPAESPAPTAPEPSAAPPAAPAPSGNGKAFVSPVVARIAGEHGIDPSQVPGTGSGGRVTKKDILAFVESGGAQEAPAAPQPTAPAPEVPQAPAPQPPAEAAPRPAPPKPPAPAPVAAGETLPG